MERRFDLVVVGTGVTSAVATRCREGGWTVAVVDSRPFGGTCALRGCIPKKILVGAAEAVHHARDMANIGVPAGTLTIDWPALMRFKRSLIDSFRRRPEAGALRLPDVRLRHSLHALRRAPPRFTNAWVYPTKIRE
jgi:glutathione reductase (NADPH)